VVVRREKKEICTVGSIGERKGKYALLVVEESERGKYALFSPTCFYRG
jgi:hypothetical protein